MTNPPPLRPISEKELFYDRLGPRFAESLSDYDTQRRVELLVGEWLASLPLAGKQALDVGCGLGFFSQALQALGAHVLATDLAPSLVEQVKLRVGCAAQVADALSLQAHFGPNAFDLVVSSECIEHTPDPSAALAQMCRVLRPGGYLAVSTPNLLWYPVVWAASKSGLRPFDGLENFSTFGRLRQVLHQEGLELLAEKGLHLFPFQLGLHGLSRACDQHLQALRPLMINLCLFARKPL